MEREISKGRGRFGGSLVAGRQEQTVKNLRGGTLGDRGGNLWEVSPSQVKTNIMVVDMGTEMGVTRGLVGGPDPFTHYYSLTERGKERGKKKKRYREKVRGEKGDGQKGKVVKAPPNTQVGQGVEFQDKKREKREAG